MTTINQVGVGLSGASGTGNFAGTNSPTFVGPTLGAASGTSLSLTGNVSANNAVLGYTTTATAGSSTTLIVSSTYQQFFTGSSTQTVLMPVTSTLTLGQSWLIVNISTGNVTVQSSGANNIVVLTPNTQTVVTCILTSGTTAASWSASSIADAPFPLPLTDGGTNASLTASNGGIFYSTASAGAILSGTATADQILLSGSSTTPAWSTATYPATTTANQLLYSSATNTIAGLSTLVNGVLVTDNSGVPELLANSGTAGFVLTANTGAPPSWQAGGGGSGFTTITQQVFTSSTGTYTPTSGMKYCIVEVIGGGGSGGGVATSASNNNGACSGGGGGGGYAWRVFSAAQVGATGVYTVGAGGTAPTAGNNPGNTGGTSSLVLTGTGTVTISATGGVGGTGSATVALNSNNTSIAGGAGGTGSNGTINIAGQVGGNSFGAEYGNNIDTIQAGNGGSSHYGAGAIGSSGSWSTTADTSAAGITGQVYGGGGSGCYSAGTASTARAGGAGAAGIVIITEYI